MKFTTSTAIALVVALSAAPAAAQYAPSAAPEQTPQQQAPSQQKEAPTEPGKIKLSREAGKAIIELQTAVNAKDAANIPGKIAAAKAVAKTADDRYAIGRLELNAAADSNDNEAAATAVDDIAASKFLPNATVAALYNSVGVKFFNAKNHARAIAMFQKAQSMDPNNVETLRLLAESQASTGNPAEALGAMKQTMAQAKASGQKLPEDTYKRAVRIAYDAKSPDAINFGRDWIAAYPSPDSWHNALAIYRNLNNPDPDVAIDILRLSRVTNSMTGTGDYHIYAFEAANQGNYGEAKSLISEGLASGKIKASDPVVQEIQGALKGKAAPTAAELATAEKTAKVPTAYLRVGDRYYGAGNYAKAAELYKEALAKGADANLANLRLGEALAMAGDKAGATAALNAVQGSLADIAKFWLVYVQRQA